MADADPTVTDLPAARRPADGDAGEAEPSGVERAATARPVDELSAAERAFIGEARRAVLATIGPDGHPRLVPICFVLGRTRDRRGRAILYSPIDEKPKGSSDPRSLARVRDLLTRPGAQVLVDRWSEDWTRLGWIRLTARGELLEAASGPAIRRERADAIRDLRAKYPQYATHDLDGRPILRFVIHEARRWGDLSPAPTPR